MPYIQEHLKTFLKASISSVCNDMNNMDDHGTLSSGILNYLVSSICKDFLSIKGKNYENLNAIIGALDCAKEEFRRRIVNPYEDVKSKENGDIY
jgi:hypothetical protein